MRDGDFFNVLFTPNLYCTAGGSDPFRGKRRLKELFGPLLVSVAYTYIPYVSSFFEIMMCMTDVVTFYIKLQSDGKRVSHYRVIS